MLRHIIHTISSKLSTISRSRKLLFLATFFVVLAIFAPFISAHAADSSGSALNPMNWPGLLVELLVGLYIKLLLAITGLALSLIVFVLTFIMEIAAYNGYLYSTAVNVGWVMVRDLTNMVFVVIMLIIAFGSILGSEDYGWKHLLFRMIGMAILVNFSRTICGLVIDAAQVVMITFLNGIAATATSNVINAFGLNDIKSFIPDTPTEQINQVQVIVAASAGVFVSITILVAISCYLVVLVGRMAYLWVLIVLSPIAFSFSVLHSGPLHHFAEDWRKKFIDNVITGPILIFFLWLTFVTVGNGQVATEIAKKSSIPDSQKITEITGESSGIGKVLKWNSLANFVIAIAMLVIGLQTAAHLGGVGAHFVEHHALELGKEATMFATGAHTIKHAGQHKAEEYGQLVKLKAQSYGLALKNRANVALGGEDAKGIKRWMQFGSGHKRNEKLESIVKHQEELLHNNTNVSDGVKKQEVDLAVRVEQIEKFGKIKRQQKLLAREKELMDAEHAEQAAAGGHGDENGEHKPVTDFGKREKKMFEAQAKLSELESAIKREQMPHLAENEFAKKALEKGDKLANAVALDNELKRRGEKPRYEMKERADQAEALEKEMSGLNFREITKQAGEYAKQLQDLQIKLEVTTNKEDRDKLEKDITKKSEQVTATLTAANKRGAETGLSAIQEAADAIGIKERINPDNASETQKLIMTILSGNAERSADGKTSIARGSFEDVEKIHGENTNILMRGLDAAFKTAGKDYAPALTAVFNDEKVDDNGTAQYSMQEDEKGKKSQNYWVATVSVPKVTDLAGLIGNVKANKVGKQAIKNFTSVFRKVNKNTIIDSRLVDQWKEMKGSLQNQLLKALEEEKVDAAREFAAKMSGKRQADETDNNNDDAGNDDTGEPSDDEN